MSAAPSTHVVKGLNLAAEHAEKMNRRARRNRAAAIRRGDHEAADRWHLFACYWNGARAAYLHAAGGAAPR